MLYIENLRVFVLMEINVISTAYPGMPNVFYYVNPVIITHAEGIRQNITAKVYLLICK